nr:MAG TPA: hypothetical protein [Caudoviricetes sp.]
MRSTGQMFQRIQEYRLKELAIRDGRIDILHSARMAFHMFSVAEQIVGQQKMVGIVHSRLQNLQNVGLRMKKWRRNIGRIDMFVLNPSGAGGCGCSKAEQL